MKCDKKTKNAPQIPLFRQIPPCRMCILTKGEPVLADERFGAHFIAYFIYGKAVKGFPNKLSVAAPVPAAAFRLRPVAGGFVHSRGRRKKHGH